MKLLLHTCCGPCTIYPLHVLRQNNYDVYGYFYSANIHPYTECKKRFETLEHYARENDLEIIAPDTYDIENFLQNIVFREKNRCFFCYHARLKATASIAKKGKFDCFSTTLLYSKYQNHQAIRTIGETVEKQMGIPFFYMDFRSGWKEGISESKRLKLYRQQYCGCIYSEKERYFRK
ncbi:MAG: epoxyqueuosine reductase QueH [Desulfobacteraceae bacterium]|nr:epoxyqueuosine reductase QueH [Desulfobacteraceae bacterium]